MDSWWPWLAVAGLGALHGLNPIGGWFWAAVAGVRSGDRMQAWRALGPIAIGHLAAAGVVALAVPLALSHGLAMEPGLLFAAALGLVLFAALRCVRPSGGAVASMTLMSFLVSTAQGSGLMLVPALMPLCIGEGAVRQITASGSMALALAALALHTVAMLAVAGTLASVACFIASARQSADDDSLASRGFLASLRRVGSRRGRGAFLRSLRLRRQP
jgi:hypothetical protein